MAPVTRSAYPFNEMENDAGPRDREWSDVHLLRALVQRAPVGIAFLDTSFRYGLINETLASINGHPIEAHIGRTVKDIIPELWPRFQPIYERVLSEKRPIMGREVSRKSKVPAEHDASTWLTSYYPVSGRDGGVIGIGVIATDVTDRKRMEGELRRLSEHQSAILSALPDLMFELGADSTHLGFHAPVAGSMYTTSERFMGKTVREVLPGHVADVYEQAIVRTLSSGTMEVFEYDLIYPDGTTRLFDARMVKKSDDRVLVIVRDVTERRNLEEQFRHAQKMEAIGRLAGGVAHDFNNLLTVINGCTAMVLDGDIDASARELLDEVSQAGQRAASLTRQLLLFSRQQVLDPQVLDIREVVEETKRMLLRLIGEDVELEARIPAGLPGVRLDRGQFEQVLVNLIVNARDAMPSGGRIIISATAVTVDAPASGEQRPDPGSYLLMTVEDNGAGMEDDVRARIFEPFFTTKDPGIGTGLGLAVVFGAMRGIGGFVNVRSEVGQGTAFELYFPTVGDATSGKVPERAVVIPLPRGHETILLVEDDAAVQAVTARILSAAGYTLLLASDGREALSIATSYEGAIHLMISDVVIPHISGRELAQLVQRLRPSLPVLFMSGYTNDEVIRRGVLGAHMSFIQKPFAARALAAKVRERLDAG